MEPKGEVAAASPKDVPKNVTQVVSFRPLPLKVAVVDAVAHVPEGVVDDIAAERQRIVEQDPNATSPHPPSGEPLPAAVPTARPEDIPAPTAAEGDKTTKDAVVKALPRAEQLNRQLTLAGTVIEGSNVAFGTPETQAVAKASLESNGGDIKSVLGALGAIETYVSDVPQEHQRIQEIRRDLGQNVVIEHGGKLFILSELETRAIAGDTEAAAIMNDGKYELVTDIENMDRVLIDQAVAEQITVLEELIPRARENGADTKSREQLLIRLKHAQMAKGEVGGALSVGALTALNDNSLEPMINDHGVRVETQANQRILAHLSEQGYTQEQIVGIWKDVLSGNIDAVHQSGVLTKARLDVLVYGKPMADEELQKSLNGLLTQEQKAALEKKFGKKDLGALILILLAAGVFNKLQESVH